MPPAYRRRKVHAPVLARSPSKTLDFNADFIPLSDPAPAVSTDSQSNVASTRDSTTFASTPALEDVVAEPAHSPVYSPTEPPNTSTPVNTPARSTTPTEPASPSSKHASEVAETADGEVPSGRPVPASPSNPFSASSPAIVKAGGLREAIEKGRMASAVRMADCSPSVWLTTPMGRTGAPILDHAMDDLRASRYGLWMGDPYRVLQNCSWVNDPVRSSSATLQWKPDAQSKLEHDEGDALIGFLGTVSADGLTVTPDANWQTSWGEDKLHKQKRSFRTVYPGMASKVPESWWDTQFAGALRLIDEGLNAAGDPEYEVTHSFANKTDRYLRVRSPVFLPARPVQEDQDPDSVQWDESDEGTHSLARPRGGKKDVPKRCHFSTWNIPSRDVRSAFDRHIAEGYRAQILQAYNRYNNIIHPNNLTGTLSGAIVLVHCTLERMQFSKDQKKDQAGKDKERKIEFQFYANLVKVQVLKLGSAVQPVAAYKRRYIHSYGPSDGFESDDQGSEGAISKRPALASANH
ncbi:hypothetical protein FRC09_001114 [Ceratobasidium sp. 395]|nr:hypothetical protein FRC09_001114 [Ceratobasidium sp. 395]